MSIAEAKASMARAYASGEAPRLQSVSPDGINEIWTLSDVLFLLPVVPPDASPEFEYALRLRRDASLSGECEECGATFAVEPAEGLQDTSVSTGLFPHRRNCLAGDANIYPLLSAYARKKNKTTLEESLTAASRATEDKILSAIPNPVRVPMTSTLNERFLRIIDEKLATIRNRCPHLKANPVQTWHAFMWGDSWRCDECSLRFATTRIIRNSLFRSLGTSIQLL